MVKWGETRTTMDLGHQVMHEKTPGDALSKHDL